MQIPRPTFETEKITVSPPGDLLAEVFPSLFQLDAHLLVCCNGDLQLFPGQDWLKSSSSAIQIGSQMALVHG